MGHLEAQQCQAPRLLILVGKGRPVQFNDVDFDARTEELLEEPGEESIDTQSLMKGGIYEVHAKNSDGLLLPLRSRIPEIDVQEHLAGLRARLGLEANAQPSVLLVRALVIAGCDRVGENEEVADPCRETALDG
jgi:hypothetical protein